MRLALGVATRPCMCVSIRRPLIEASGSSAKDTAKLLSGISINETGFEAPRLLVHFSLALFGSDAGTASHPTTPSDSD